MEHISAIKFMRIVTSFDLSGIGERSSGEKEGDFKDGGSGICPGRMRSAK